MNAQPGRDRHRKVTDYPKMFSNDDWSRNAGVAFLRLSSLDGGHRQPGATISQGGEMRAAKNRKLWVVHLRNAAQA